MTTRSAFSRRTALVSAAAAAAGAGLTAVPAAPAAAAGTASTPGQDGSKSTVVLVHGAFADASSWSPVTERLQRCGHQVIAVPNPLRGLAHDAAQVAARLAAVPGPVVLAGHSYGGAVITQAAAAAANVRALVYIAAFMPDAGEVLGELAGRFPGSQLEAALTPVPVPGPEGGPTADLYIRPDRFHDVFAQDVPHSVTRVLSAGQRPLNGTAFTDRCTAAAWRTLPSWTLICGQDRGIAPQLQRFQAQRAGSRTAEVLSSHLPMHSRPDAVVSLIRAAARAV
ncbi:alpha/beta hydrolase [Streptomyces sp. NPDC051286]|uniref:alpha/beta hydrolase n=1 Tax=Streptomyces sp. NPDC051286 TaxID=3365647 RepID=UPI0037B639EB